MPTDPHRQVGRESPKPPRQPCSATSCRRSWATRISAVATERSPTTASASAAAARTAASASRSIPTRLSAHEGSRQAAPTAGTARARTAAAGVSAPPRSCGTSLLTNPAGPARPDSDLDPKGSSAATSARSHRSARDSDRQERRRRHRPWYRPRDQASATRLDRLPRSQPAKTAGGRQPHLGVPVVQSLDQCRRGPCMAHVAERCRVRRSHRPSAVTQPGNGAVELARGQKVVGNRLPRLAGDGRGHPVSSSFRAAASSARGSTASPSSSPRRTVRPVPARACGGPAGGPHGDGAMSAGERSRA